MCLIIVFFFVLMVAAAIDLTAIAKCKHTISKVAIIMATYVICMEIELRIINYIVMKAA